MGKDLQHHIRQRTDLQNIQRTQETCHQKNKLFNFKKMGYRPKPEHSTDEYNGQKILKEMLNMLSHQRKANQNNSEIPSYTCQNDQDQKQ